MPCNCTFRLLRLALLASLVIVAAVMAQARLESGRALDANPEIWLRTQDGSYLDANPQVGSGGFNYRSGRGSRQNSDIWSRQYYEVTRSGQNRFNAPANHGQNQRYRASNHYTNHDYHRNSYSGGRRTQTTRQNTRRR